MNIELKNYIDGEGQIVIIVPKDMHERYDGSYSFTPTKSEQKVECKEEIMSDDITIEAIPDKYIDTDDATAEAGHILSGKTAYVGREKLTGSMTNHGTWVDSIISKAEEITIPGGYHSGSGKVKIGDAEKEKIISENIKKGITILGITGTYEAPDNFINLNDFASTDTVMALVLDIATEIKAYRFYKNPKVSSLTAPEVLTVGNYGVAECPNLASVILAKCTTLSQNAFYGCTGLTSFSAPALTRVGFAALRGCTDLVSFSNFEALTYIGESAFNSCTSLVFTDDTLQLSSPEIYANAFYGVGNIQTVDFSGIPKLNANAFYNCPNLKTVYFHQTANSLAATAFNGCTGITDIYVPWSSSDAINIDAPWGATNATIHYDTVFDANGNPVIS